jgi:cytoskeletal protein CcmA (bactofilin family)
MWKRDEAVRQPAVPTNDATAAAAPAAATQATRPDPLQTMKSQQGRDVVNIGKSVVIKGELFAKSVVVLGEVIGNVSASEKVDIRENGSVEGDITSPRVAIAEGAHFRGSVDMANKGKAAAGPRPAEARPQPVSAPQAVAPQAQKVG